ncbi:MAG: lipocalin family protein [Bacteroidales bacterium]
MKSYLKIFGIFSLGLLLTLASCKDDDDDKAPSKTTKDYLTAGFWTTTSMAINPAIDFGGGMVITDYYTMMPACEQDNLIRFNADGTITDDEGATKCDPSAPQTVTEGTWQLSSDNASLTVDYPDEDPMTLVIIELNDNTFKGKYTFLEDFGFGLTTYEVTITMVK